MGRWAGAQLWNRETEEFEKTSGWWKPTGSCVCCRNSGICILAEEGMGLRAAAAGCVTINLVGMTSAFGASGVTDAAETRI